MSDAEQMPPAQRTDYAKPTTRFRPRYRQLAADELALHDAIKAKAEELATLVEQIKPGRCRSIALTELESAVMWAIKELTL